METAEVEMITYEHKFKELWNLIQSHQSELE